VSFLVFAVLLLGGGLKLSGQTSVSPEHFYSLNGPRSVIDIGNDLALDTSDNVLLTGRIDGNGPAPIYLGDMIALRLSSEGVPSWTRTVSLPGNIAEEGILVASDQLQNVYVAGYAATQPYGPDVLLAKFSSTGEQLWQVQYSSPTNNSPAGSSADFPRKLHVTPDGSRVVVAGVAGGCFKTIDPCLSQPSDPTAACSGKMSTRAHPMLLSR